MTNPETFELIALPEEADRYRGLLAEVETLTNDDDAFTWLDQDPDVAWNVPADDPDPTYYGRLAHIYARAGWERCYHDDARFHFNVKTNGNAAYQGMRSELAKVNPVAYDRLSDVASREHDRNIERWWESDLIEFVKYEMKSSAQVWACGRSGGYVNTAQMETDPVSMVRFAAWLEDQRAFFNSEEYGADLVITAIEEDTETQLAKLASPRPDRIEA